MESFSSGMAKGIAARAAGAKTMKVFDWKKAKLLIQLHQATNARAGLDPDWDYTGGEIWRDGEPVKDSPPCIHLQSIWATPQIQIDDEEAVDCFLEVTEEPSWGPSDLWPENP